MTDPIDREDDAARIGELAPGLAAIDVEPDRAAEILGRARRGPSALRFVEPVVTAVIASSYLAWAIVKIVEAIGR